MTTPALTLSDFDGKFKDIKSHVTNDTLSLINKSETMKAQIRSYQADTQTQAVILNTEKADSASYTVPRLTEGKLDKGFATFGVNRINTPEGFFRVVSHELGHYAVENPGATIANARANTAAALDVAGYEAACNLTEGYARLATAKGIAEVEAQSGASVTLAKLISASEYVQYKSLLPGAAEASWTSADLDNALAFALGESNKSNMASTSTTPETYLEYCSKSANSVIHTGASAPAGTAPAEQDGATVLSNTLDADGNRTSNIATQDAQGELHPTYRDSDYAPGEGGGGGETTITLDGQQTGSFYDSDGALTGRSKTLDGAGGAPTTDSLANMLQSLRNATGDMDDLVLDAAELRTLSGSQAEGEAWGGARLLTLGDSVLGDYYRHHHDIQTGAAIPLLLDDPQTQGLGLLGGFDLGNGASVLDSGSDTSTTWDYQAPAGGGLDYFDWGYDSSVVDYAGYSYDSNTYSYNTYTYDSYDYSAYHYGSYNYDSYDSYDYGWSSWWPVALDMDNDGIELVAQEDSHAWYDVQGDGYRRNIGWVGSDDAFLAIDENHDGKITDARELSFAMWTADTGDTDLQALQTAFDTNQDQKLDAQDGRFADLRTWQDKNGDGVSDAGEVKTLAEAGIKSIGLTVAQTDWSSGGNHVSGFATYEKTNGTRGWAADVGLGYDTQGWKASVESNLVRMTESGGLVYGIARSSALNLDLGAQGLDGAIGGAASDTLAAGSKKAVLLEGGAGNDKLTGGAGDDWLAGDVGSDTLSGGEGDDTLVIDAQDAQANLAGGAGFDMAVVTGYAAVSLDLGAAGVEAAVGGAGSDNLRTSGTGRVILAGGEGSDILTGSVAGDLLYGGTGNDSLYGGRGNDVYVFNRGDGVDAISDAATAMATTITTRVEYYPVVVLAGPVVGNPTYQGYLNTAQAFLQSKGEPIGSEAYSFILTKFMISSRNWQYSTASRTIETTSTAEVAVDAGQDTLRFGAGIGREDLALTTSGADWAFSITHNGLMISDRITLINQTNSKARIEFVEFSDGQKYAMDDLVFGTTGADVLAGTAAANVLSGGAGGDAMRGGAGNDAYVIDNAGDSVVENANEGTDTVLSSVSYSLGANVENLGLTGSAALNGTGNALNNTLIGNAGNNILDGGLGDDTLDGGLGNDVMQGGTGNDNYVADNAGDVVVETSSLPSEIDTVLASVSYTLSANVENLTLTGSAAINGTGNVLTNTLIGNGSANILGGGLGNDTLDGGAGTDTLNGGDGDDRYRFGLDGGRDTIVETSGNDRIVFGAGISAAQITASMTNGQVTLSVASGNSVSFAAPAINNYAVEQFEFADGSVKDAAWLNGLLNVAPTGTNNTLTFNEDNSYTVTIADLGFSDANPGDSLSAVRIDNLPAAGSLKLNGANVTATQIISAADLAAGRLVFNPAANANGNNYASLSFSVKDQSGTFDATPNTLAFNVTAVNDAPALTGAKATLSAGTEDTVYAITQASLLAGFSDVEGSALSVVSLNASNGALSAFNAATGSWTFTPNANFNGTVNLSYSVSDGTVNTPATQSFTLAAVNDAPTGTATISGTLIQNQILTAANTLADVDGLGAVSYQWMAGGTAIAGATGASLALTQAQVGKAISVKASYTDLKGTAESVTSASTAPVANVNDAPTGAVSISGTATQNQTLTATNTLADADGLGALSYQWMASGTAIAGATGSTLTLGQAQVGKAITVKASYMDVLGSAEAVNSSATALVANVNDAPTGTATISGTATQNQTLTATNTLADTDGLGPVSYQWMANGTAIAGATSSTLALAQAQVGKAITVKANYTDGFSAAESVTSASTAAVANVNDAPTGAVTITGTLSQNQTLTAANTLADADGLGSVTYQWQANGAAIAGATSSTLTLGQAQVGKTISVKASYTDVLGTAEGLTSAATAAVANVNDAPSGIVTINGTSTQNQTLTATHTLTDADGLGAVSYQWLASGTVIAGATGATLSLGQAQVGKTISVKASYTDALGSAEAVSSSATALVANVNDAPTLTGAKAVLAGGTEDTAYTITQASLLTGFSDADGNTLSVSYLGANHGSMSAFNAATGSWTFTPSADYYGNINVTYSVSDGTAVTNASQGFTLAAVNDAPLLSGTKAALAAGTEDIAYTITQVNLLAGFGDADGNALSVVNLSASNGSLSAFNAATGSWIFTPSANYNGTVSLSYGVSDGTAITSATQSFTLAAVNDAPTLTAFSIPLTTVAEDNETQITLVQLQAQGNAADVDGTVNTFVIKSVSSGSLRIGTTAATATAWNSGTNNTVDATRNAYWTPTANANGTLNAFTAVAKDNSAAESITAIQATVAVTPVNDTPILSGAQATFNPGIEDTAYVITEAGLLAGFSDWDGNTLSVVNLSASNGGLSTFNTSTRSWSFTPNANYNGVVNLNYGVSDGTDIVAATQRLVLAAVNDAPTFAVSGKVSTDFGVTSNNAQAVLIQSDGKIVVAGNSGWSGNAYSNVALARYLTDGTLDSSFDDDGKVTTGVAGTIMSAALQADGKIIVAGEKSMGSKSAFSMLRYNSNGSLDTTFGSGGEAYTDFGTGWNRAESITLQRDGKILLAGTVYGATGHTFALARYNSNGSLDTSFDGDGKVTTNMGMDNWGYSVAVQDDNKVVVAGFSNADFAIARYNTDGSLDTGFDGDGKLVTKFAIGGGSGALSIAMQGDGRILAGGGVGDVFGAGGTDFGVTRYLSDGRLDTSFSEDGKLTTAVGTESDYLQGIAVQADGKILAAGYSKNGIKGNDFALVRYNTDGSLDSRFGSNGVVLTDFAQKADQAYDVKLQSDGKILVSGISFNTKGSAFALARYNPDGSLDATFAAANTLDGRATYAENSPAILLDNSVVVYDAELAARGNYAGASISLFRHGGANADDVFAGASPLSFRASTIPGQQVINAELSYDGTIGTVSNANGVLTLTFNSNATQDRVNLALSSLTYSNRSDNPPASVEIDWVFSDGAATAQGTGGVQSVIGSSIVSITASNDAPLSANQTLTFNEDSTKVFAVSDFGFSDPDISDTLRAVAIKSVPGAGALQLNGNAVWANQSILATDIAAGKLKFTPAANANGDGYASFGFQVSDGALLSGTYTASLNVKPVRDDMDLAGTSGIDRLTGDQIDVGSYDRLSGLAGDDFLDGKAGNDTLIGGAGSDTYQMSRGYGVDTVQENDATPGITDVLSFGAGVSANQLWFGKAGNDLQVSIIGTADKAILQNWYSGNAYHVEQIKSGDGKMLQDTRVDALVQAMAGFAPPAMGQMDLSTAYTAQLAPALAASWS